MPDNTVVAFYNSNPYPVALDIEGIRGRVSLEPGQQIRSKDGVPILPNKSEWPRLMSLGVKPITVDVEQPPIKTEKDPFETIILNDPAIIAAHEKKAEASITAAVSAEIQSEIDRHILMQLSLTEDETVEIVESESVAPISHLDDPANPSPLNQDIVWQKSDGQWIYNKDGFSSLSAPAIKRHIKKDFGQEVFEKAEFIRFGTD